ncbi:hypothetical protein LXA43DRAFT_1068703 [Ganoderma leucocontextum]|nr:hypothetical protein LXA43DRAFT_1068703 [Ganoderma leucocontextum]
MFIGDLMIRWAIVLPLMTIVALVVTGVGLIHQFAISQPTGSIFSTTVGRWITAYCVMTFCTKIYGTVAITYRIWASNHILKRTGLRDGGHSLLPENDLATKEAMVIFVESAALYMAWGMFFVVVYGLQSHLQIISTGCAPVVLGVTFMLITVRVGLGWGQESRVGGTTIQ